MKWQGSINAKKALVNAANWNIYILVDASGQKVRFNVSNSKGTDKCITSSKGRTTTAAVRSTKAKTLMNESGKLPLTPLKEKAPALLGSRGRGKAMCVTWSGK